MAFVIGGVLALSVGLFASFIGLDRDRAFYPTVMIVVASYYALFAVMGGSTEVLLLEAVAIAVFILAAEAGFRHSLWLVVAGLGEVALAANAVLWQVWSLMVYSTFYTAK